MATGTGRDSDQKNWPFRNPDDIGESSTSMNQRLVSGLVHRKFELKSLPAWQSRSLKALGIEISQSRQEKSARSMQEAAQFSGLDPAFFAIAEAGDALPSEITHDVLRALARGANSSVPDLESALSVRESAHSRNPAGLLIDSILSLCQPSFLNTATAFKSGTTSPATSDLSDLYNDDQAGISYRIGGLSDQNPPSLVFYELNNPDFPLANWNISVRNGVEELASGTTDSEGVFKCPPALPDFPPNAHLLIRKPD